MWTETFHRFPTEAAFLAACDAPGWARGPDGKASPPAGIVLDVVGPAVDPPVLTGTVITQGDVDPRWHVVAAWFSGTATPPRFTADEVFPERPVRMFAVKDTRQKVAVLKALFDARKLAKPDNPKLTPITFNKEAVV